MFTGLEGCFCLRLLLTITWISREDEFRMDEFNLFVWKTSRFRALAARRGLHCDASVRMRHAADGILLAPLGFFLE